MFVGQQTQLKTFCSLVIWFLESEKLTKKAGLIKLQTVGLFHHYIGELGEGNCV